MVEPKLENVIYSIWMIPEDSFRSFASKIIVELSQKYKLTPFKPHITLIGVKPCENIKEKFKKLVEFIEAPLKFTLGEVGYDKPPWMALYVRVIPSASFLKLRRKAENLFKVSRKWEPHLSFLYAEENQIPILERRRLAKEIEEELKDKINSEFCIERIELWKTWKEVSRWKLVRSSRIEFL